MSVKGLTPIPLRQRFREISLRTKWKYCAVACLQTSPNELKTVLRTEVKLEDMTVQKNFFM